MKFKFILLIQLIGFLHLSSCQEIYPVLILHGLFNACSGPKIVRLNEQLELGLGKETYVKCLEPAGYIESFTTGLQYQIDKACDLLNEDENFKGDISVVGISQGGVIGRALIEECEFQGTIKRFVSIAGPQMGIASCPFCFSGPSCLPYNLFIQQYAYTDYSQENIGPAGYINNYRNQQAYLEGNTVLPYLNNQITPINTHYKESILNLELMFLVNNAEDQIVDPNTSPWFYFYNEKKQIVPIWEQEIYINDTIGLQTLQDRGSLRFIELPGKHTDFTNEQIQKYFVPALSGLTIPDSMDVNDLKKL